MSVKINSKKREAQLNLTKFYIFDELGFTITGAVLGALEVMQQAQTKQLKKSLKGMKLDPNNPLINMEDLDLDAAQTKVDYSLLYEVIPELKDVDVEQEFINKYDSLGKSLYKKASDQLINLINAVVNDLALPEKEEAPEKEAK